MSFKGYYLNLKNSNHRNTSLKKHLKEIKLYNHFERFEAFEPDKKNDFRGIKKGEYGLWISIMNFLDKIEDKNDKKLVLLIEDDFRFDSSSASRLEKVIDNLNYSNKDIIFLDYHITIPLLKKINFVSQKKADSNYFEESFFLASEDYYACTSAILIRKSCANFLLDLLRKTFKKLYINRNLIPIDMLLKYLFKKELIKGYLLYPPLGSPDFKYDEASTIQVDRESSIRKSMRAYLLFRCAVSGTKPIKFCSQEFAKIVDQKINLEKFNNLNDFYKLVSENKDRLRHDW